MTWPLKLALAGDIYPVRPLFAGSAHAAFDEVLEVVRTADAAVGNFEIPLTRHAVPVEKLLNIKADPAIAREVPKLGFQVLTLANNHSVDYGWQGLSDTIDVLRGEGLLLVGAGATQSDAARAAVIDVNGIRVGVLGFSCLLPTGMSAGPDRPGIAPIHVETSYEIDPYYQMEEPGDPSVVTIRSRVRNADLAFAAEAIRSNRPLADVLIVSVHWGFGSGERLAGYQQPLGHAFIDAGADLVHGHHPHAVHPIEFYRGKPILYGVGTFIGQQVFLQATPQVQALWRQMSPDGLLVEAVFERDGRASLAALPTTLDADRLPTRARGTVFERIFETLRRLSLPFGTLIQAADDRLSISPSNASKEMP